MHWYRRARTLVRTAAQMTTRRNCATLLALLLHRRTRPSRTGRRRRRYRPRAQSPIRRAGWASFRSREGRILDRPSCRRHVCRRLSFERRRVPSRSWHFSAVCSSRHLRAPRQGQRRHRSPLHSAYSQEGYRHLRRVFALQQAPAPAALLVPLLTAASALADQLQGMRLPRIVLSTIVRRASCDGHLGVHRRPHRRRLAPCPAPRQPFDHSPHAAPCAASRLSPGRLQQVAAPPARARARSTIPSGRFSCRKAATVS